MRVVAHAGEWIALNNIIIPAMKAIEITPLAAMRSPSIDSGGERSERVRPCAMIRYVIHHPQMAPMKWPPITDRASGRFWPNDKVKADGPRLGKIRGCPDSQAANAGTGMSTPTCKRPKRDRLFMLWIIA